MTWANDSPTILSISPENPVHLRQKRTLLLKKKILGAGIIGLGLGVGVGALKGYVLNVSLVITINSFLH